MNRVGAGTVYRYKTLRGTAVSLVGNAVSSRIEKRSNDTIGRIATFPNLNVGFLLKRENIILFYWLGEG